MKTLQELVRLDEKRHATVFCAKGVYMCGRLK